MLFRDFPDLGFSEMNRSRSVPPLIEVPLAKDPELWTLTKRVEYHL